ERVQSEVAQLASQLADALAGHDSSASTATDISQHLTKTSHKNGVASETAEHLRWQVQGLLKEIARRQDPTSPQMRNWKPMKALCPLAASIRSSHLVLFCSIPTPHAQNQKLFGIIRKMGAKMEVGECRYRGALEKEQGEAVRGAHEAITALQEQLKAQRRAHDIKMQAFIKERDSLKVLITQA
ncbi:hypothetical protein BJV78DRAFT_1087694, partial [Lactifluus subvellereus]